jgi:hypothetical protein
MAEGDALKFRVDLVGNLVQELVAGGKAANVAEGNVQALTAAIMEMTEASKKKEEGLFVFDLAEGSHMAIDLVKDLAERVYDLGKEIVLAAAHAQDLSLALRLNVGAEGAEQINAIAEKFKDTKFGPEFIKQKLLPLLEVGLGKDEPDLLNQIAVAASDVATRQNDPAAFGEVLDAFKRIHTRREVSARLLVGLGINEKDFYTDLGETLGRGAVDAEAQVKAGKVKAETLEAELLGEIAKRQGGKLGIATDESVKSLGTTLERIQRLPEDIFVQVADSPGLALAQERANKFIDTLTEGENGQRIVKALGDGLDHISVDLLGSEDAAKHFTQAIVDGIPHAIAVVEKLADALGIVVDLIEKNDVVHRAIRRGLLYGAGGAAIGSILPGVGTLLGFGAAFVGGAIGGAGTADEEPTPTKQAHDFLWRNGEAVQLDPADTVVGAKGAAGRGLVDVMSSGGSSRSITLAPELHFHVQTSAGAPAEDLTQQLGEGMRAELSRFLDEAAVRFGAA